MKTDHVGRAGFHGLLGVVLLLLVGAGGEAATLYVDVNSAGPVPPFASWATAAARIQDAVDASKAGDEIVVTNGVYAVGGRAVYGIMTNRVAVDRPITLRSVNGPQFTIIQGYQLPGTTNGDGAIRCVYLTNGAILSGFTLTNGATRGAAGTSAADQTAGGVYCASLTAVVTNCVLAGNSAYGYGGGVSGGTLNNCSLSGNSSVGQYGFAGGGAYASTLNQCILSGNLGSGATSCTLTNSTLTANWGEAGGGASDSALTDCIVNGNWAGQGGGVYSSTLTNCLLSGNSATNAGGGAYWSLLINCTLTGNSAGQAGGGGYGFYSAFVKEVCVLYNSIVYSNFAPVSPDCECTQYDSCLPAADTGPGYGNINDPPQFVDTANGNFRLQPSSPCINAGNNAYVATATDLDGNPRIVNGTVDIGAYEFRGSSGLIGFHTWLAQYGLPTDGSADYVDSDGDGMNNWQEWIAGTNPTNAASALMLLTPALAGTNFTLNWQSAVGIGYFVQRSTNLGVPASFFPMATNLPGQLGTTSFTDTNGAGAGPLFYRVGVGN